MKREVREKTNKNKTIKTMVPVVAYKSRTELLDKMRLATLMALRGRYKSFGPLTTLTLQLTLCDQRVQEHTGRNREI